MTDGTSECIAGYPGWASPADCATCSDTLCTMKRTCINLTRRTGSEAMLHLAHKVVVAQSRIIWLCGQLAFRDSDAGGRDGDAHLRATTDWLRRAEQEVPE